MNPKTKVYKNGVLLNPQKRTSRGMFTTRSIVSKIIELCESALYAVLGLITVGMIGAAVYSQTVSPTLVEAFNAPQVTIEHSMSAVLQRIGDCESGNGTKGSGHQFNKDGSVVMHQNTNGTIDVGKFQINTHKDNLKLAAKLKVDILTEDGNTKMAEYIYENVGTSPWNSSSKCWL